MLGRWFFGLLLRSILSLSGTIFLSCRHKFRMAGQDREDGLFQCRLVPRGLILNLGMTFALRIMGQRLGDELRFLPPHAVKDLNGRLLLRVIHIKTKGEPAGLHFIGHGDHLPPETA